MSEQTEWQALSSPSPPLFPGKLINPIVVSCLDRSEFCDWIQNFKAADVPVLSPPPPVYDIIYTPTQREVRPTGQKQLHCSQLWVINNYRVSNLRLVCKCVGGVNLCMRKGEDRQHGSASSVNNQHNYEIYNYYNLKPHACSFAFSQFIKFLFVPWSLGSSVWQVEWKQPRPEWVS